MDNSKWKWALDVQEKSAVPIYKKFWPGCTIDPIDQLGTENGVAKRLDFDGLDKVIRLKDKNHQSMHLSQRFRDGSARDEDDIDFGLKYSSSYGNNSEYHRLTVAEREGNYMPDKYSFGITKNHDPSSGFKILKIYDMRRFIRAVNEGTILGTVYSPHGKDIHKDETIFFNLEQMEPFVIQSLDRLADINGKLSRNNITK